MPGAMVLLLLPLFWASSPPTQKYQTDLQDCNHELDHSKAVTIWHY